MPPRCLSSATELDQQCCALGDSLLGEGQVWQRHLEFCSGHVILEMPTAHPTVFPEGS